MAPIPLTLRATDRHGRDRFGSGRNNLSAGEQIDFLISGRAPLIPDRRGNDSSSRVHFVSVGVIAFVPSLTAWENWSEWVDGIGAA